VTRPRTNITLEEADAALVRAEIDRVEGELGFRPSIAQVVAGLIRRELGGNPVDSA
jgi:hypothetical protein